MRKDLEEILPDFTHVCEERKPGESAGEFWLRLFGKYPPFSVAHVAALIGPDTDRSAFFAAWAIAPGRMLAYDGQGDRFHLHWRQPLASWLFLKGWPVAEIHLRPWRDRTVHFADIARFSGKPRREGLRDVAILSPYVPWPLGHGGAVRIYNLLRVCSGNWNLHLFAFRESRDELDLGPLGELCVSVTIVRKPEYGRLRWASWWPAEVHEYDTPAMHRALSEADYDLLQVEFTQLARYGGDVLVEHDVTMDLACQEWKRKGGLKRWWNWLRWQRYEKTALEHYRNVIVMSERDQRSIGGEIVPNGVDLELFEPVEEPEGMRMLFVGSVRHYPNALAVRFLIEEFWPRMRQLEPAAELEIVMGPNSELYYPTNEAKAQPGLYLHGFVKHVRDLYERTNLVLIPTPVSAGTNIKALEAMSMQRAILSSPSGVHGLGLAPDEHVCIAEGLDEFVAQAMELLRNRSRRQSMARKARMVAQTRYDWRAIGAKQEEVWRRTLS